jgi:hypothetical protein
VEVAARKLQEPDGVATGLSFSDAAGVVIAGGGVVETPVEVCGGRGRAGGRLLG